MVERRTSSPGTSYRRRCADGTVPPLGDRCPQRTSIEFHVGEVREQDIDGVGVLVGLGIAVPSGRACGFRRTRRSKCLSCTFTLQRRCRSVPSHRAAHRLDARPEPGRLRFRGVAPARRLRRWALPNDRGRPKPDLQPGRLRRAELWSESDG